MSNRFTTTTTAFVGIGERLVRHADWIVGVGVLGMIVTLVMPVSPVILDVLVATNITI